MNERRAVAREPLVELDRIGKRFGGVVALTSVSLELYEGHVTGLIGPNGAGKTTLFDVLTGVQRATGGRIRFAGDDITGMSATSRARRGIRRTFQRQQVFGWLTVEENVLVALEWEGGGGGVFADLVAFGPRRRIERRRREIVRETLERLNLAADRHTIAGHLPIGKARALELARVLVGQPRVVLLDEPTSGLTAAEIDTLGGVVDDLRDSGDCAVLLVEHDVPFVMARCDHIVVLDLGEVIAVGTPAEIRDNDVVRAAYLGNVQSAGGLSA